MFDREEKPIDLQLPTSANRDFYVPPVTIEPPPRVFKEKTIKSIIPDEDSNVPDTFKKRKFGGNKRNVRQRVDDD